MDMTTDLTEAVRIYLALFFTFVAAFYSTRILYLKRREKVAVVHPGARLSATWWNHMIFRFFRVTIWLVCVVRVFEPSVDSYLAPIGALQRDWVILTGVFLLTFGFGLSVACHFILGAAWRSGFDREAQPQIRTAGLYRFSRNPSFLGVILAQFGFWLALPTWFSTVCLGVGLVVIIRQTLAEERYMEARGAERYSEYKRKVRRWI